MRGKIEYLSDSTLEVRVAPILYLTPKTSSAERDKYWAPVDLLRDSPLGLEKQRMDERPPDRELEGI
jgi:hypothetical protein